MNVFIHPSKVSGLITAPPSKSYSHRALIAASLAHGTSQIHNMLQADDIEVTKTALQKLGIKIKRDKNTYKVIGNSGKFHPTGKNIILNCKDSGTSLRFLTALSSLCATKITLDGSIRLRKRPLGELVLALTDLGIEVKATEGNFAPVEVLGGALKGGTLTVNGSESSQYISALLLIAPFCDSGLTIYTRDLKSAPYLSVTVEVMDAFGINVTKTNECFSVQNDQSYKGISYTVESDFSSASFLLAAAAVTGSYVKVTNLNLHSVQPDVKILAVLKDMGCTITKGSNWVELFGRPLNAITLDMGNCPDLVPVVCILAAHAKGTSTISNIAHLKLKESDRIHAISTQLSKMGIIVRSDNESIIVEGGKPHGAKIDTYNDHRIAMSFAVCALAAKGATEITSAQVVSKSYPDFFSDLKLIGAKIQS